MSKRKQPSRPKKPKGPRYILKGEDLFIHVDDLTGALKIYGVEQPIAKAVEALVIWRGRTISENKK